MSNSVYVAGTGIISAIGNSISESIDAFRNHRSGVDFIKHLVTRHQGTFPLAEVKLSNEQLAELTGLRPTLSRTILLSYYAARQALDTLPDNLIKKHRAGFISASSVGGMDKTEFFFEDYMNDPMSGDLHNVQHHDCGKPTNYVCEQLGIRGFVSTISTACSSSANAIMLGARMIKSNKLDIVIAGGVDPLTRFTLNGFNSLMIVDRNQCRPLDQSREGLNLGEGAAYLVLVSEKIAEEWNLTKLCKITGYCNTNDSYHQTALSDEGNGPYLAMAGALKMSGLQPGDIDYINMHGTGTQNNDNAEGKAIERVFHPNYPLLSSTKSFTGHTLGASGAIEAAFSAMAIHEGLIYPNFSFKEAMQGLAITPVTKLRENQNVTHVLSNSFGFGGNCTSLIFSKA
jgi:3-oxoacyl-[acyl-carrier-protein] synthase I